MNNRVLNCSNLTRILMYLDKGCVKLTSSSEANVVRMLQRSRTEALNVTIVSAVDIDTTVDKFTKMFGQQPSFVNRLPSQRTRGVVVFLETVVPDQQCEVEWSEVHYC